VKKLIKKGGIVNKTEKEIKTHLIETQIQAERGLKRNLRNPTQKNTKNQQ
jgi:hypothetical protein